MWIGISDQEKEGVWKSARTGNIISYTNWRTGQPDGGTGQNCAFIANESPYELWNDIPCPSIFIKSFVCIKGAT